MFKLFLADLRQLKRIFLVLVLSLPLMYMLDKFLNRLILPTSMAVHVGDSIVQINDPSATYSGWLFALMASVILLLFSADSGSQGRLPSLLSLPLARWQVAVLRHLPAVTIIPVLGLIFIGLRIAIKFVYGISMTNAWQQEHTVTWENVKSCMVWSFESLTNNFGVGYSSVLFQLLSWTCMSVLISAIPLLIDDIWPKIKRSSFALWLSVSLLIGIALQVGLFLLGKSVGLELMPHMALPDIVTPAAPSGQPTLMAIEMTLALVILGVELWWFQRRTSYV